MGWSEAHSQGRHLAGQGEEEMAAREGDPAGNVQVSTQK